MVLTDEDMPNVPEWLQAIVKLGIPGAALIFLVYWLTVTFDHRLEAMETQHKTMGEHNSRMEDLSKGAATVNDRVLRVLLASCVNNAKTDNQRRECLQ